MSSVISSFVFRTLNPDGTTYGRGCFSFEGPPEGVDIQHNMGVSAGGTANRMISFWYQDPVTEVRELTNLINFNFTNGWQGAHYRFDFNLWNFPYNSHGMTAGQAQPGKPGPISGHRGVGDVSNQKKLEWPNTAPAQVTVGANGSGAAAAEPAVAVVPKVDLVVVIDSSVSMKDEATALSKAVSAAIEAAKTSCPSDLVVTYLGIEGIFKGTQFERTVRAHLTETCGTKDADLRGRKFGTIAGGGGQEDGARALEDVALHHKWRPDSARAIFYLGDESLEGGNEVSKQDQADIEAATRAIGVAKTANVKVHTYLGTSGVKAKVKAEIGAEYARVASETGGKSFTSQDALSGFTALLQKVICGSKPAPPVPKPDPTQPFCCCQEFVSGKHKSF